MLRRLGPTIERRKFFPRRAEEGLSRISLNVLDLALEVLDREGDFLHLKAAIAEH
jgi:hypothetical protein